MNGIVLLTLSVALQGDVALQSGIEFGWTELPDNRVEYIIQLDEPALDALKNGQPLTSSIPPEIQSADRIRIQYGSGGLNKPILSRKPQTGGAPGFSMVSGGFQGEPRNAGSIADTPPALNVNELRSQGNSFGNRGQVTVKNGNQNSVSNSSLGATRRTTYLTQENGTNSAIHWSNSNRVIGNFDNQNRTADTRTNSGLQANGAGATGNNLNNNNLNNNIPGSGPVGGNSNVAKRAGSGFGQNATGNNTNFNNSNQGQAGNQPTNTGFGNGMTSVPNRNRNNVGRNNTGWNSVNNRTNANGGQGGMLNPNNLANSNSLMNPNALNPNVLNPNAMNPNAMVNPNFANSGIPNTNIAANGFRPAPNYIPQQNPNLVAQPGGVVGVPVTTTVPSNEVAMLNKTIEEMKSQQRVRDHEGEIAKLKSDQKAELEKLTTQFKEFQKKKESSTTTPPIIQAKENDEKRGNSSGIASVFLVISLGLNVFLVVQYLSVQNQFRDLSNDLRDTFMTNSYE